MKNIKKTILFFTIICLSPIIKAQSSPRALNFGYNAGKGGKAGFGGWSAINTTPHNMSAKNECTGTNCSTAGGGGGCAGNVCNPDYAMCLLASTTNYGTAVGSNDIDFKNSSGTVLGKYISKNTTGDGDLEMYVYNCSTPTVYKAICKGDCDVLFKQIARVANVNTEYKPTMPVGGTTCSTTLSFPFNINFVDQSFGNIPLLVFNHADINTPATLTDISGGSDHVGTFTSCFSILGVGNGEEYFNSSYNPPPVQAPAGNPGVAGPAPTPPATGGGTPPPTDNVIIDENDSWFTSGVNTLKLNNAFSAIAYPNPADKDLNIELESEINITAYVTVKDINGKEVITTKQKLQSGKNKFTLDVAKLKAGLYFITINANNKQSVLKVTVQ